MYSIDEMLKISSFRGKILTGMWHYLARYCSQEAKNQALIMCAYGGANVAIVADAIQLGAEINSLEICDRSDLKITALMCAAERNHVNIIAELLRLGAAVDIVDQNGNTALMHAVANNNIKAVEALIVAGADVSHINQGGLTALHAAIKNGVNSNIIIKLVSLVSEGHGGQIALTYAVKYDRLDVIDELVKIDVDLNHVDQNGCTALMRAIRKGKVDVAVKLIELGAIDLPDEDEQTALMHAIESNYIPVLDALIKAGADVSLNLREEVKHAGHLDVIITLAKADKNGEQQGLWLTFKYAIEYSHFKIIDELVTLGVDIDKSEFPYDIFTPKGQTALMIAAQEGLTDVVIKLIKIGADVNLINNNGDTALIYAIANNNIDALERLIKAGANVAYINQKKQETILMYAAKHSNIMLLDALLKAGAGANINYTNDYGFTALHVAIVNGRSIDFIAKLLEVVNDVDDTSGGRTALIWAVTFNRLEAIEVIIKFGADVNKIVKIRGQEEQTALMVAARLGQKKAVIKLIELGAKLDITAPNEKTALTYASGNPEITDILLRARANGQIENTTEIVKMYYVNNIVHDNSILNHESLLREAYEIGGTKAINLFLELGQDKDAAEQILCSIDDIGMEQTLDIFLGNANPIDHQVVHMSDANQIKAMPDSANKGSQTIIVYQHEEGYWVEKPEDLHGFVPVTLTRHLWWEMQTTADVRAAQRQSPNHLNEMQFNRNVATDLPLAEPDAAIDHGSLLIALAGVIAVLGLGSS